MSSVSGSIDDWTRYSTFDRLKREVQYNIMTGLENVPNPSNHPHSKVTRKFSFVRRKGVAYLLRYLAKITDDPASIKELEIFIRLQTIPEYSSTQPQCPCNNLVGPKLIDALRACQSEIPHVAILEIQLTIELFQGLCLHSGYTRHLFKDAQNLRLILSLLSVDDDQIRVTTLEFLQCLMSEQDTEIVKNFEDHNGLQKVSDLLRRRYISEDVIHGCIECLYVYLSPDRPSTLVDGTVEYAKWADGRLSRKRVLDSIVGENFVKQLLDTAGIGTISQKSGAFSTAT